ncbi:MAG: hypothetical protein C0P74_009150 [Gammaproteobacteria bacterium]
MTLPTIRRRVDHTAFCERNLEEYGNPGQGKRQSAAAHTHRGWRSTFDQPIDFRRINARQVDSGWRSEWRLLREARFGFAIMSEFEQIPEDCIKILWLHAFHGTPDLHQRAATLRVRGTKLRIHVIT